MDAWNRNGKEEATSAASARCDVPPVCAQLHIGRPAGTDIYFTEVSLNCVARTPTEVDRMHFNCALFISIRSLLPLVLAQLLIQFQKPIVVEHALAVNGSRSIINDTVPQLVNNSVHRSVRALGGTFSFEEFDNSIRSANLFAPDYSIGRCAYRDCPFASIHFAFCFTFLAFVHAQQTTAETRWAAFTWWTMWKMNRLSTCSHRRRPKVINTTSSCWTWHDRTSTSSSTTYGTTRIGWPRWCSRWFSSLACSRTMRTCGCECTAHKCGSHAARWSTEK